MDEGTAKNLCETEDSGVKQTNREPEKNRSTGGVNRVLLPVKVLYFMIFAAQACQLPYVIVFTKQLGLTSQESGMLFGVLPFLSFLAQVGIGMIADRWRKHKVVLMTCIFIAGVFNVLIVAVPPRPARNVLKANAQIKCHSFLSPTLTFCPHGVSSYVSSAGDVSNGTIESVHSLSEADSNHPWARSEFLAKEATDDFNQVCRQDILGALTELTFTDNNSQTITHNWQCRVSCSKPSQADAAGTVCLGNISNAKIFSTSQSYSCNGTKYQNFPEIIYLQNLRKVTADPRAVTERSKLVQYENDGDNCSKFHISSLFVVGRLFDTLTCDPQQNLNCMIQCDAARENVCHGSAFSLDLTFCLVLLTQLIGALALSPVYALIDAACYGILKDSWRNYGHQRVWGTIGALTVAIGTSLGVYVGKGLDYTFLFCSHGALMLLSIVIAYFVKMPSDICFGNILKNTRKVIFMPKVAALLAVVLVFGIMFGATLFVLWYLEDLGAPPLIFGLYNMIGVSVEIPAFFLAGRPIRRFGPIPCFCMGVAAMSLRLAGYALLVNPWLALLVVTLQGVAAALVMSSSSSYINLVTPPGMSATAQGLLNGLRVNMGRGIGVILTGWMMGAVGPHVTFASYAAAGLTASALYALLHYCVFRETLPTKADSEQQTEEKRETPKNPAIADTDKPVDYETDRPNLEPTSDLSHQVVAPANRHAGPCHPLLAGVENNADVERV